jgi:DNA-binding NarL/FixJ family response regulator
LPITKRQSLIANDQPAIPVLVIAPSPLLRAGLRALLGEVEGARVVGEVSDLAEVETLADEAQILCFVAGAGAPEELSVLLADSPDLAVLMLVEDDSPVYPVLPGGRAWGVLSLDASAEELAAALHALSEGLLVGAPALFEPLLVARVAHAQPMEDQLIEPLTERELEVLQQLAQGLANKQIALSLGISEHTVKFHISGIYSKLGATNRTEAVRLGVRRGLVVL